MKDRFILISGLLALLVGLAGVLGTGIAAASTAPTGAMGDASAPYDLRFLDGMIMHHQGAVMSSEMMIADSERPEMRRLAESIIASQTRQIEQLRRLRGEWYPDAPATSGVAGCERMMGAVTGMGGMMGHKHGMDRMMRGDADRVFLRMMISHHRLAVEMSEEAIEKAEHQEIKDLARTIIEEQTAEIELMEGYPEKWYGEDAPEDMHGMMRR